MLLGTYRFACRFLSPAVVPAFKGSMLRGAFGHAFKQVSCALRRRNCDSCLLAATCPYSVVFENHAAKQGNDAEAPVRVAARPHPYTMQPPLDTALVYQRDDAFSFGISLFGKANDFLPHIVYAVQLMGEAGLGRRAKEDRAGRFVLHTVTCQGQEIYSDRTQAIDRSLALTELLVAPPPAPSPSAQGWLLEVTFITPLRLKHQNQLQDTLPFHILIRTALRRAAVLEQYHGAGEPALDYRGLIQRAEKITSLACDCRWLDWQRYSARQKTAMLLGGLVGTIRYAGDVDEFLPVLRYCEQTQLGKQTSFGLGQIAVHTPAAS